MAKPIYDGATTCGEWVNKKCNDLSQTDKLKAFSGPKNKHLEVILTIRTFLQCNT